MNRFILASLTTALLASGSSMAAGLDALHEFGTTTGVGHHVSIKSAEPQTFGFTVPAGHNKTDIVFSEDPNTRDRSSRVTLVTWKEGETPTTTMVNYSRVRTTTIAVTPGRYYFTVTAAPEIAFAVMVRHRKIVVPRAVATPPRTR
ncbi:MAG: hypothetical protein ABIQ72_19610 [Usitatibacter sp.]